MRTNAKLSEEAQKKEGAPNLLPDVRFCELWHGHATMMLSMGDHPKVVQERLGHSPISLTIDTYSHVLPTVDKMIQEPLSVFLPVATGRAEKSLPLPRSWV
jgi:site-specific recombinase XerD